MVRYNKNNLVPNQPAAEYAYCLSNILAWHRNGITVYHNENPCVCSV